MAAAWYVISATVMTEASELSLMICDSTLAIEGATMRRACG